MPGEGCIDRSGFGFIIEKREMTLESQFRMNRNSVGNEGG